MAARYDNHPQYIPIIKWQKFEQRALSELVAPVLGRTLPCIEVRLPGQHASMLECYADVWKQPALVDYSSPDGVLTASRIKELKEFLKVVGGSGKLVTPVLNPVTAATDFPAIARSLGNRKVALRLRMEELGDAPAGIPIVKAALAVPGLRERVERLIVDLGQTPATSAADRPVLAASLQAMKNQGFEHVHLASGSFPASLAHINGAGEVKRKDWELWTQINTLAPDTLIGFSDYGALNPNWSEETLKRRGSRVIIRYALDDKWRIVRGQNSTKAESIAISKIMTTVYAKEFQGAAFSFGDRLIADRVDPALPLKKKTGGHLHISEFWTHHISYVLKKQY
ncbi:beta family protein [Stenotrophomonas rhizophila]|uniref:beta family protein n=1 Tax=Stenotrophomonas rhizophila TaxID=216778 RepID=UPI0010C05612|nr:hypothetical protein [Stenotrophomonas rhizophila]TKK07559.1 hypothetical protein SrhCFBP13529_12365 [Stenotrophomonas rhizophila]